MHFSSVILALLLFSTVSTDEISEKIDETETLSSTPSPVADLTKSNFKEFIEKNPISLVEFYAPWCHHCKQLAPHYDDAARLMRDAENPMAFGKVDSTAEPELSQEYGIEGYPTLKIFHKNSPTPFEYDGPREPGSAIADYLTSFADPNWTPPLSDVAVLTSENFTSFTTNEDFTLVEFYAPWCAHCKRLEPKFEKAASMLKSSNVRLAKVDGTVETELQQKHNVTGYPSLCVYRKGGKWFKYEGEVTERAIVQYMREFSQIPTKEIKNLNDYKYLFRQQEKPVLIGLFNSENDPLYSIFLDYAYQNRRSFEFAHSFESLSSLSDVQRPAIVLQHHPEIRTKYEQEKYVFNKIDSTKEDFTKFIEKYEVPLVGILTIENRQRAYFHRRPICIVIYELDFSFDHRDRTQYWRNKILKVALQYKDKYTFAIADETRMEPLLKEAGLEESDEDVNVVCYDQKGLKYRMEDDDEFTTETFENFIRRLDKGQITPFIKSQPIPKQTHMNDVRIVVAKTFDDIVRDSAKDVLIFFYAPWCKHCTKFKPTYSKLAQHYSKKPNVVIAQMDVTLNEVPSDFDVSGFPTIYFVSKTNQLFKYQGHREFDDLREFIDSNIHSKEEL